MHVTYGTGHGLVRRRERGRATRRSQPAPGTQGAIPATGLLQATSTINLDGRVCARGSWCVPLCPRSGRPDPMVVAHPPWYSCCGICSDLLRAVPEDVIARDR